MSSRGVQFWRPGDSRGPSQQSASVTTRAQKGGRGGQLPVEAHRLEFLYALETHRTVVVVAETGAGKTTQLPQFCADAGWTANGKSIAVALPRQVAVVAAATRVARERGLDDALLGGDYVGYAVRLNAKRSRSTKIVYFTDGSLLSCMLANPLLSTVSVVIVDDAHERGVATDLLLGLLRKVQQWRGDLRVVIASATIDAKEMRSFFGDNETAVLRMTGRCFPVRTMFSKRPVPDYIDAALQAVKDSFYEWERAERPRGADVLVFVTGAEEAEELCSSINNWAQSIDSDRSLRQKRLNGADGANRYSKKRSRDSDPPLHAVPLYASLSPSRQLDALHGSASGQKVVVATNVAETSLTVDGLSTVIDSGFEKAKVYLPRSKSAVLSVVPISQASAQQRAGRAGRTRPGKCVRLYTEQFYNTRMARVSPPEILRCDLAPTVLALKAVGVDDVGGFKFLTPPPEESLASALERLHILGALGADGQLERPIGLRMTGIPLSPPLAKSLIVAESYGVGSSLAAVAAMLEVHQLVFGDNTRAGDKARAIFAVAEGDLVTLLNVFRRYVSNSKQSSSTRWCRKHGINAGAMAKATRVHAHLCKSLKRESHGPARIANRAMGLTVAECVCRSLAAGLFENAAMVEPNGTYLQALSGRRVRIHPSSVLQGRMPKWVVFTELVHTSETYMRNVTVVQPEWLAETAPHAFESLSGASPNLTQP